jgi:hypothetical protein
MEYVTSQFVEQVRDELRHGRLHLVNRHALLQATAKPEIRETQARLIFKPVAEHITITEVCWAKLLQTCRSHPHLASGYAAGNLLNLLCYHNQDLRHYDFSKLTIRHADLREVNLQQLNFEQAHFVQSILPDPLLWSREFDSAISAARRAAEIAQNRAPRSARDTILRVRRIHV